MPEASKAVTKQAPAEQSGDALEQQLLAQAKSPQERAMAFSLASTARQHKMLRDVALAVSETGWGKDVSPMGRAAVIRYCLEIGADPVNHVHVLGGNVYLNANFWRDLVAANPKFLRAETTYIHADDRADAEEQERRKVARVTYGVPEQAKGAAIVTLHYQDRGPFIGVNWAGARKNDPVGDQEPTKTAESRAYRRAAMKAETAWFKSHPRLQATQEILLAERMDAKLHPASDMVPPMPIEGGGVAQLAAPEPITEEPRTVSHNPNAKCRREGLHLATECALETPPKAA